LIKIKISRKDKHSQEEKEMIFKFTIITIAAGLYFFTQYIN